MLLKAGDQVSPVFESPLGLFDPEHHGAGAGEPLRHPAAGYLTGLMSPVGVKRLDEFDGDISQFTVVKLHALEAAPAVCVAKTEPGDENNQDISSLVGKVDIRRLEMHAQNDPDAYSYSGGLNRATQGLLEFVEMFKAPIKMLHPLLTATQEGNYVGTENIGAIPFTGVVMAHSNEAEWQSVQEQQEQRSLHRPHLRGQGALLPADHRRARDLREADLQLSELSEAPCAPGTLEMLARFCGADSRLKEHENSNLFSKMRVYDGENLKDVDPKAKSMQEYRDAAGVDEGMNGVSTRFAFKVLAETFNFDNDEVAADPVHLMYVLEQAIRRAQLPGRDREALRRVHQERAGAALRRVHRQRDPEGLPGELRRLRPEPVRPLRRLRRRLDRGPGLQGSRHRRDVRPQAARTRSSPRSRSRPASPTRRTSATRW